MIATIPTAMSPFVMMALEPVWVPFALSRDAVIKPDARKSRARNPGPNGESPDSGKWKLRLPASMGGGVYNGPTLSASALDTASECMHKWALDRLDGHEKPRNEPAERGTEKHAELEAWLKYGTRPTTQGMPEVLTHFPPPGACESESYFGFVFGRPGDELVFAGYLDARESVLDGWQAGMVDDDGIIQMSQPAMNSTIRDLKTTGDWRWKKNAAQLTANIQAAIYALGEILRIEGASPGARVDGVILKWTYALLKLNKDGTSRITRVATTADEVDDVGGGTGGIGVWMGRETAIKVIAQYLPLAEKMFALIVADAKAADTAKNTQACAMYGGCHWKKPDVIQIGQTDQGEEIRGSACIPPAGGGFMSLLRQERTKLGIEVGPSKMLVVENKQSMMMEQKMATGLAARFGKKMDAGSVNGAAVAVAVAPVVAAVAAVAPAVAVVAAAPTGLAARFGKKSTSVAAVALAAPVPAAPTKLEQKATEDGMSAKAVGDAPGAGATLPARLKALKDAPAVEAAVANAPTHALGTAPVLAVGINPPDAAPEWSLQQQAAEAARLAGVKPTLVVDGSESGVTPKRGRGRPAGSTASAVAEAYTVAQAAADADGIAGRLLAAGFRKEAMLMLTVTEQLGA